MTRPPFFDTNILLYSISHDAAEATGRGRDDHKSVPLTRPAWK
jgi:predicted nucleic acid-binding protein